MFAASHQVSWSRTRFSKVIMLSVLVLFAAPAHPSTETRSSIAFMHGLWAGEGHVLLIDVCRHQARFGVEKPFSFESLRVRDVTGGFAVFSIGPRPLIGLFQEETLSLTGYGIVGSPQLHRVDPLGATGPDRVLCQSPVL